MTVTLMDFHADWCGPCKTQDPILEDLMEDWEGRVEFEKIDVDEHQDIANQYQVRSIPTIIVEDDEGVVERFVGVTQRDAIESALEKAGGKRAVDWCGPELTGSRTRRPPHEVPRIGLRVSLTAANLPRIDGAAGSNPRSGQAIHSPPTSPVTRSRQVSKPARHCGRSAMWSMNPGPPSASAPSQNGHRSGSSQKVAPEVWSVGNMDTYC